MALLPLFSKQVPASLFGGKESEKSWVGMGVVPMGWSSAVDFIQQVTRSIAFDRARIPSNIEVRSDALFPSGSSYALICIDGLDVVAIVDHIAKKERMTEYLPAVASCCRDLRLPLAEHKVLLKVAAASVLGAQVSGPQGTMGISHKRASTHTWTSSAMLLRDSWTSHMLQHWAGYAACSCTCSAVCVLCPVQRLRPN